jgi:ATP-dependent exoDNAse (exonuclease V) alpha subunit
MLDELFANWTDDVRAGRRSLMVAADTATVADLNRRARAHAVSEGRVAEDGVTVANGSVIGVGDVVVTRQNQRDLGSSGWVKNGDQWEVTSIGRDGSMHVRRESGGGVAHLPAEYVAAHVELGYATTARRAQGRTVDTTHAYVTSTTMREPLYVMATRGRETNMLYVDTKYDADTATSHQEPEEMDPVDVLKQALARSGAELSATETRDREAIHTLGPGRAEAEGAAITAVHRARHAQVCRESDWRRQEI